MHSKVPLTTTNSQLINKQQIHSDIHSLYYLNINIMIYPRYNFSEFFTAFRVLIAEYFHFLSFLNRAWSFQWGRKNLYV